MGDPPAVSRPGNVCIATVRGTTFYAVPPGMLRVFVARLLSATELAEVEDLLNRTTGGAAECRALGDTHETVCLMRRHTSATYFYFMRYCARNNETIFSETLPVRLERAAVYAMISSLGRDEHIQVLQRQLAELRAACCVMGARVSALSQPP